MKYKNFSGYDGARQAPFYPVKLHENDPKLEMYILALTFASDHG